MKIKKKSANTKKAVKKYELGTDQSWQNFIQSQNNKGQFSTAEQAPQQTNFNWAKSAGQFGTGFAGSLATSPNNSGSTADNVTKYGTAATDGIVSAIPGFGQFYGMAAGASKSIDGMIPGTTYQDPKTGQTVTRKDSNAGQAVSHVLKPSHQQAFDTFGRAAGEKDSGKKTAAIFEGIGDMIGWTQIPKMIRAGAGKDPVQQSGPMEEQPNYNNAPTYEHGGGLEHYKLGSHNTMGDNFANTQLDGNPIQIEKQETVYRGGKNDYVFSDSIGFNKSGELETNPKLVKKTFADESKKVENQTKRPFMDSIANKTKEIKFNELMQKNDLVKNFLEQKNNPVPQAVDGMNGLQFTNGNYGEINNNTNEILARIRGQYDPNGNMVTTDANGYWDKSIYGAMNDNKIGTAYRQQPQLQSQTTPTTQQKNYGIPAGPTSSTFLNQPPGTFAVPDYKTVNQNDENSQKWSNNLTTGDALQLAGIAPATLYNLGMGLQPAEKQALHSDLSPINRQVISKDYSPLTMAQNTAKQAINASTSSDAVRRSALSNLAGTVGEKGQAYSLAVDNQNKALTTDYENRKAGQNRFNIGNQYLTDDINAKNRAAKRGFLAEAATDLGVGLTEFGKAKNQGKSNEMLYGVLQNLYKDYAYEGETFSDFKNRVNTDIKFKNSNSKLTVKKKGK